MKQIEKDKAFYKFAYNFLLKKTPDYITGKIIKSYLEVAKPENNVASLNDIFKKMLSSAQSGSMYPKVIGGAIDGIENLGKVLDNFNVDYVVNNFDGKEELLLDVIQNVLRPKGKIRKSLQSLWPKYCKTIISTARFLNQFNDEKGFITWTNKYCGDEIDIAVLPLLISTEIYGFGFALVCDFLKDLGYKDYGKPDVHIKDILKAYGFTDPRAADYFVLKTMIRISRNAGISCFELDGILWLIGSGNFYKHRSLGNNGLVGRMKDDFIKLKDEFTKNFPMDHQR